MWQRFTERARRVVFFAQEEAGRLGENYVATEHLLLGMIRENDSLAARILIRMGFVLPRIRQEVERQVTKGTTQHGKDMQLTPRAKRVIDLAYDEARQLSNNYIGTEHLLLGLIREKEGLAGRVLSQLGVDLERTREEIRTLQAAGPEAPSRADKELIQQLNALPAEQQTELSGEGMKFIDLPETMQQAIQDAVLRNLSRATLDQTQALIRMEKSEEDGILRYILITTPAIRIDLRAE